MTDCVDFKQSIKVEKRGNVQDVVVALAQKETWFINRQTVSQYDIHAPCFRSASKIYLGLVWNKNQIRFSRFLGRYKLLLF